MFKKNHPNYFVTKDNIRIYYNTNFLPDKKSTNQPVMLFNYGLVCNNNHWKEQLAYFDKIKMNLLIHDYRAHYRSSGKNNISKCNFANITNDLKQLIIHLKLKNVFMLGHSMGVNITLEFVKKYPKLVKGIILISGSVIHKEDSDDLNILDMLSTYNVINHLHPYLKKFHESFPLLYQQIWKNSYLNPFFRKFIHFGGFNTKRIPDKFVHDYLKKMGELDPKIFHLMFKEMNEQQLDKHLKKMTTPTLIIGGDSDKVVSNDLQFILHKKLPNSELYIVKNGSHVPQTDFPETINSRIEQFIKKNI